MEFEFLWKDFSKLDEVEAIALGGSRAGNNYDETSDYDLYIYCSSLPDEDSRKHILEKYCNYMEIGNSFWELEDDCTLKSGRDIDILWRSLDSFASSIHMTVDLHQACNGYSTCLWHNLLNCRILYDSKGRLEKLQKQYQVPYPENLKNNIIENNRRLLAGSLPSYDRQIKKALSRNDLPSVNHRTAAYLESYFDVIFALNRLTHPGEKRMTEYALDHATLLPDDFQSSLDSLFKALYADPDGVMLIIEKMNVSLNRLISQNR